MSFSLLLSHLIGGSVGSTMLLMFSIIVCCLLLEDLTAIIVGVLSASGVVSIPVALISLYIGVILGDIGLYWLGWLASIHPKLGKYAEHDFTAPFRSWLENSYALTIFSATFITGTRFPTYTASGFFHLKFSTFIVYVLYSMFIWMTFLFCVSYWFGAFSSEWMGPVRWGVAGIFALILLIVGWYNLRTYRAKEKKLV
jgi:membrane protein DedA with SNARE-associated domain